MDALDNRGKNLTSHKEKIDKARQIVRGLMDDIDCSANSQSELETEIMSETNNVSLARRQAMLQAISLPARTQMAADLANALAVLIKLERQFYNLD